jgi:AcrR family transcriptional regulator
VPKISDIQREARRQAILDAALRCFSRDGFHAATTPDIAREAGVSQGALYLYFPTKEDMVVALADDRHRSEAFLNALASSEPDPIQGLLLLFELYGKGLTDPERVDARRVGIQGWAESLRNPRIQASSVEGMTRVREAIVGLIERGQAAGQVRKNVDADCLARTLIAFFQGLVLQVAWGEPIDLEGCGALMREMIAATLLTRP